MQSGIGGDVGLMKAAGIDVRGVVDTGTLLLLLNPRPIDAGSGAKHQIEAVWPNRNCHVPYDWKTFRKAFEQQRLTPKARRHVVQDVLTPFAVLFAAVIKRVLQDRCDDRDIMPLVHEALELCYTKEPKDVRQRLDGRSFRQFWIPPVQGSEFTLNSRTEMALIRRARGHYVERFSGATMQEKEDSAREIWKGNVIPCQRHLVFKAANWCFRQSEWCQNCASEEHKTSECPSRRTSCPIEHYKGINHPPHWILMCPQLHSFCHVCKIRGHLEQLHPSLELTPRELRQDFMQHCHRSVYSSLPYLYEPGGPLNNHHWKASMMNQRMSRGQSDMWVYRGLNYSVPRDLADARARRQAVIESNLESTEATYRKIPD